MEQRPLVRAGEHIERENEDVQDWRDLVKSVKVLGYLSSEGILQPYSWSGVRLKGSTCCFKLGVNCTGVC